MSLLESSREPIAAPDNTSDDRTERLQRELTFHDESFSNDVREQTVGKFYAITDSSYGCYRRLVFREVAGTDVLEYGCGINSDGIALAGAGARVTGIDISPVAIEKSRRAAIEAGVEGNVTYHVMDAETLEFPDGSFDRICGVGIIHHLDMERALREIRRVLRPGGRAVFHEPLGHNPLINRYRRRTPDIRTPDEHPLLRADLAMIAEGFSRATYRYFHLTSLALVPLRDTPFFKPLLAVAEGIDKAVMAVVPPLRGWAWYCVMELEK